MHCRMYENFSFSVLIEFALKMCSVAENQTSGFDGIYGGKLNFTYFPMTLGFEVLGTALLDVVLFGCMVVLFD